jgi:hypothetical protein
MGLLQDRAPLRNANTKGSAGLVVWDRNGLVVVWPDGHRSRFPWAGLRQICRRAERQHQQQQHNGSYHHLYDNREPTGEV